jgi:hypothetical protein
MVHTTTPQLLQSGQLIKNEAANQMKNANEETFARLFGLNLWVQTFQWPEAARSSSSNVLLYTEYIYTHLYKQINSGT